MAQAKQCAACKEIKDISEFPKHKKCKDGIYSNCLDCTRLKNRESYQRNITQRREDSKNWQKENKEWRRNYSNNKYKELKDKIIEAYGGRCFICGFSDRRALCLDHVNGKGLEERKSLPPMSILRKVIKENYPKEYQILCANCNQIKAIEKGEIPVSSIYRSKNGNS